MVNRLVSVGDDFTLPAAVKTTDANLPTRLGATALSATIADKIQTETPGIVTPIVDAQVSSTVPPIVASAIASDGTVAAAAASAVTTEIAGRDLLESFEATSITASTVGGFMDPNGRIAEGGAYDAKGRIPVWVQKRIAARMGVVITEPSITCYGTSMTLGQGGNGITYPGALQGMLDDPVHNYGVGGNWSRHVAARQNGRPALITVSGGSIPASGPVTVTASVDFLVGFTGGNFRTGTLAGVRGVLTRVAAIGDAGGAGTYTFTRSTAGPAVQVPLPVPWYNLDAAQRRADIAIIEPARNDLKKVGTSPEEAVANVRAMIDYLTPTTKRILVLETTPWNDEAYGAANRIDPNGLDAYNAALQAAFPHQFVRSASWLQTEEARDYAGITWTTQDLTDISNGVTPTSFRSDGGHYNASGYAAFAYRIYQELVARGWAVGRFIKSDLIFGDDTLDKAQVTYASDSFDRADGAPGSTPIGGYAWTAMDSRTWAIAAGELKPTTVATGTAGALYITESHTDGVLSVKTVDVGTTGVMPGLFFRGQSDGGGYVFYGPEGGVYALRSRPASGSLATIAASTVASAAGDVISVELSGTTIKCKVNGVTVITVTDSTYTGTRKGIWVYQTAGTALRRFDNFSWKSLI